MAETVVQHAAAGASNGLSVTSGTATFTNAVTPGNTIIAVIKCAIQPTSVFLQISSISTTNQLALTLADGAAGSGTLGAGVWLYYLENVGNLSSYKAVVGNWATNSVWTIEAMEVSGLATSASLHAHNVANATSTAPAAALTTTVTTFVVAGLAVYGDGTVTVAAGTGYSITDTNQLNGSTSKYTGSAEFQADVAAGTFSPSFALGTSDAWGCVAAAFVIPGTAASPTPNGVFDFYPPGLQAPNNRNLAFETYAPFGVIPPPPLPTPTGVFDLIPPGQQSPIYRVFAFEQYTPPGAPDPLTFIPPSPFLPRVSPDLRAPGMRPAAFHQFVPFAPLINPFLVSAATLVAPLLLYKDATGMWRACMRYLVTGPGEDSAIALRGISGAGTSQSGSDSAATVYAAAQAQLATNEGMNFAGGDAFTDPFSA